MNLWPKDLEEARKVQETLKRKLKIVPLSSKIEYICGVDAAFSGPFVYACASLFKFPELIPLEDKISKRRIDFPYIPTFLSFREGRAIMEAIKSLKIIPHVLLFDGHGIAHPLSMGIASHIGILLDLPSIGCAKSRLIGEYESPDKEKGSLTFLYEKGKVIGAVLRTRSNVKPVFVSPGHLIDLFTSCDIILKSTKGFRLPEPIRRAHQVLKEYLKKEER